MNAGKIITLLTDFGTKDTYVGQIKGIIMSINPDAAIVDITHEIEPQDIREGAFLLNEYYRYFPEGTINITIVDPDVGSGRRPVIVLKDGYIFVGPDNGIFTLIAGDDTELYSIENKEFMSKKISPTFHGRDIFAPVAAHISKGVPVSSFGKRIDNPILLDNILPDVRTDVVYGEVVRFDRFGNAITNIDRVTLQGFIRDRKFRINIGRAVFEYISKSYFEKDVVCVFGSSDYLEFGYYRGSFREEMGVWKGDEVTVRLI